MSWWFAARVLAYGALGGIMVTSVATPAATVPSAPWYARTLCFGLWSLVVLLVALVLLLRPEWLATPRGRVARALDATLFNVAVLLLLCEGLLAITARFSSSPIFHFDALSGGTSSEAFVRDTLRRFRFKPHVQFFDKQLNSRGYVDDEPFVAGDNDFVVAVLADSFGTGIVPFDYNFATVAERRLQTELKGRFERIAVHNFGVARIGIPEYYYLALTEAAPTNPAVIAVCVFVGNDLDRGVGGHADTAGYCLLQNWRTWLLPRRLFRLHHERRAGNPALLGTIEGFPKEVPASVNDFRLEKPTFSESRFFEIERDRVAVCAAGLPYIEQRYAELLGSLREFKRALRRTLLVVVIPDEFQVDDALWERLMTSTGNPTAYDRELPQRRIVSFCQAHEIAVLDLLPLLRDAHRVEPAYHQRDTHWNARGNRIAGEAIAEWILRNRIGAPRAAAVEPESESGP